MCEQCLRLLFRSLPQSQTETERVDLDLNFGSQSVDLDRSD